MIQVSGQEDIVIKLLSEDPQNYPDAPTEAIRRALELIERKAINIGEKIDGSRIGLCSVIPILDESSRITESCRIGTTVATNALLEKKGERFALLTTKGVKYDSSFSLLLLKIL